MGLMVGNKMDSKIEENVIFHELNKYTIRNLKAVKHRNKQARLQPFSSHAGWP